MKNNKKIIAVKNKKYSGYLAMDFVFSLLMLSISLYMFSLFVISIEKYKKIEKDNLSKARILRNKLDERIIDVEEKGILGEEMIAVDEKYGLYEIREKINLDGEDVEGVTYAIRMD